MFLDLLKKDNKSTEPVYPITSIPAITKLINESNRFIKHGPEFVR